MPPSGVILKHFWAERKPFGLLSRFFFAKCCFLSLLWWNIKLGWVQASSLLSEYFFREKLLFTIFALAEYLIGPSVISLRFAFQYFFPRNCNCYENRARHFTAASKNFLSYAVIEVLAWKFSLLQVPSLILYACSRKISVLFNCRSTFSRWLKSIFER